MVSGRYEVNGSALSGASVAIADPKDNVSIDTVATYKGGFVLEEVAPGRYELGVELPAQFRAGLLRGEQVFKCSAPGFSIDRIPGVSAALESDSFTVEAGKDVVKDIILTCR